MKLPDAVTIYGASSDRLDPGALDITRRLAGRLAAAGMDIVSGGGNGGVMAAAIEGATAAGGRAVSVLPQFMIDRGWAHPGATRIIATDSMHTRKATMAGLSRAAIAMPGGVGTFEELMEIITWRQLALYQGHVIIFNYKGYFDPLLDMLQRATDWHLMRPGSDRLWHVVDNIDDAVRIALSPTVTLTYERKIV